MSKRVSFYVMTGLVTLAVVVGLLLAGAIPDPATGRERAERARIENLARAEKLELDIEQKRSLSGWIVAAKVAGGALFLATVAGSVFVGLRWADRRAAEIRPGADGQFPVVRVRVGGATILHDPNRQLAAATVYARPEQAGRVVIQPVIAGRLDEQERTTARAQAVQLMSAANRHAPIGPGNGQAQRLQAGDDVQDVIEQSFPLPTRVPLSGLLNGTGASLSRLVLGVTVNQDTGANEVVTGDMGRLVHVAVGGSSGWGKSVFLRSLVYQLATCPERADLALVDLEGATFAPFANSDRLLYPIADTEADALAVYQALTDELDRRKELFSDFPGVDSLAAYNERASEAVAPLVCLTDEATALLTDKSVESALRTLALRGRKYGLWLTLGGQDWKASSLDTAIRNQLSTRVQFKALSGSQSRVLLQQSGAEDLDTPGRALAVLPGRDVVELQAPLVSLADIEAALTGNGPRRDMPQAPDAARDDRASQRAKILELAADGLSKRKIQLDVFGYTGGAAYTAVSEALESGTTTTK